MTVYLVNEVKRHLGLSPADEIFQFSACVEEGHFSLAIPWSEWSSDGLPQPCLSRGVIIAAMDHGLGYAVSASLPGAPPSTTIDLRIDWNAALLCEAGGRIVVESVSLTGDVATSHGYLEQPGSAQRHAVAVARFLVGVTPGRSTGEGAPDPAVDVAMPSGKACFPNFLGLLTLTDQRFLVPGAMRLAGQVKVGAFHGGLIAACAEEVTEHVLQDWLRHGLGRVVSLEIEYMRPAFVMKDLLLEAVLHHADHRSAMVEVISRQGAWEAPISTSSMVRWVKD